MAWPLLRTPKPNGSLLVVGRTWAYLAWREAEVGVSEVVLEDWGVDA